tara:strand:+ start:2087 stop:2494 length:408 start_codon:yes stop_codon:yes gene_type:complete
MKLDKNRLRRIIIESIDENAQNAMKIKTDLLSTYDRSYVAQAYMLCDSLGLNFEQLVREMLSEHLDSIEFQNHVHVWVNELLAIFHADKQNEFYIEDENLEADVQMDFAFKTVADITKNLEDYYVNLFVAIGQGR